MKILHVDSSILSEGSISRQLTAEIVATLKQAAPGATVTHIDLAAAPLTHLTAAHLGAAQGAPVPSALEADVAASKGALADFLASDVIVIGAPMYNFSVPSQLKAWMDRLAVAGVTFRYSEKGLEGLAGGKKLIVASTRGGVFSAGTPMAALDHQESYLTAFFGFLGITDVSFVRAEGVAMGPEAKANAVDAAIRQAHALAA
ncbi:FMN-dependent NADH-azoreductase [Xanthobacter aminoxidans]|uniref:FMN-dependent NADH-azoreductase n=1 Tax=Xanthobacter aminoxidans TaxID=186280 RepID=UPI003726CF48